ncbi:30S ribosomal protein S20 [Neoehrlichia mikurensis]|uniref:Small ribosomal subunit protein bS20 n=1 Tax=Neoehrlichia mikurensis TaxID=89586 RepID=A0A9Q9BWF4_9RICK|nr:30S ribosomal protein S20 [Neoehrlichia mikurensis]QXK92289.1 30S ribosomal protein S20 [Neoehrlichia mikurensis]QXK92743.1 30S ribosomal protein S20 [Neoehrlichia mikurensis]QXK93984.1 30S ribosomal protein S20 [Neoehrlichia mikurensis]UTO55853.1 30S ribosomal protein S20 [Neoehrlichia mikurensis]UTO56768.1 30S ribosomal protein S20 [Neoehrlichia mikurensis]
MANHLSAKKMIRVIKKRTLVNRARKSKARNSVKKFLLMLKSCNQDINMVIQAFREAESNLHKCANKKVIHKNAAARKISSLAAKLKAFDLKSSTV